MSANEAVTPIRSAQADAGVPGDVPEPAAAQVLPELVAAHLVDEIEVGAPVAVHVGGREAGAVVVVDGPVVLPHVVHGAVDEGDPALLQRGR